MSSMLMMPTNRRLSTSHRQTCGGDEGLFVDDFASEVGFAVGLQIIAEFAHKALRGPGTGFAEDVFAGMAR